jgi:methionine synthase / methylenetetrahydrofolate reductase(NADPH)
MKNRALEFREKIAERAMVADGAMGSMLYARGIFINRCFDELNLSSPNTVKAIHQEYAKAGAEILETNTFGANRLRLGSFGLSDVLRPINEAGVKLAREASDGAFVAGAVGPLGVHIEPLGALSYQEARALFSEQIETLVEAGVDLIMLETFSSLDELREAIWAARKTVGQDMAIVAQVTIDDYGNLRDGTDTQTFAKILDESGADIFGCNCSAGPKVMLETIEKIRQCSAKPLSAMPNAGHPVRVEGRNIYLCSPEYMAQYARRFLWAGVKIIGGCCGTTPEHIKLLRAEAQSLQPSQRHFSGVISETRKKTDPLPEIPIAKKSQLGAKLASGKFVTFVEILPPKGIDYLKEIEASRDCAASGIDCINVPDGPRASARMSAQVTCQLIQEHAGVEAVLHFCCRDRNILGIQSELLGAHAAGVKNLICITGDPPRMGAYPDVTAVFDVDSIGLVNIARGLNRGLDFGGNPIGSQTALLIGIGANPGALNLEEELRRLDWKIQAGAEFIVTQPVFDLDLLDQFLRRIQRPGLPVIAGIWPLASYRNAEFMVNELRLPVPKELMDRMKRADTAEAARREGIAIARDLVQQVQPMVQGIQFSAPLGRYKTALEVAEAILPQASLQDFGPQ